MKKAMLDIGKIGMILVLCVCLAGCTVALYKRYPRDKARIEELTTQIDELQRLRDKEREELKSALAELQKQLKVEISKEQVSLEMAERGLVITVTDEILFGSGKAEIKKDAYGILQKVANIVNDKVPDKNIGVEGHTDNQPIKYSGWKSNWELSTARATSVLHHLIDECDIAPGRLQATGYGEYRPIASNLTQEGMQKNRRVEIIILPKITKADLETLEKQRQAYEESTYEPPAKKRLK